VLVERKSFLDGFISDKKGLDWLHYFKASFRK